MENNLSRLCVNISDRYAEAQIFAYNAMASYTRQHGKGDFTKETARQFINTQKFITGASRIFGKDYSLDIEENAKAFEACRQVLLENLNLL